MQNNDFVLITLLHLWDKNVYAMEQETEVIIPELIFVKTDPELIRKLFARISAETKTKNPYKTERQVKALMRYNMWTVGQFCDLSGLAVSSVTNLARPNFIGNSYGDNIGTKIDVCFPFPDSGGRGLKYIIRNEKSERYIKV
jgi:hypothetical protein